MRYISLTENVRARHIAVATILLLPVVALLVWDSLTAVEPSDEPKRTIIEFGYLPLERPATIYLPGTINTVEFRSDDSVWLYPTCRMDLDVLRPMIMESKTTISEYSKRLENRFDAIVALRKMVKSTAVGEKVRNAWLSLANTRILVMPDDMLFKIRQQYIKDECEEVIMHNLRAGSLVCQTEEVLQADAVYRIDYLDGFATDQRVHTTQSFATKLGLSESTSEMDEIRGNGLFYGVKLKRHCIVPDGAEPQFAPLKTALHP